MHVILSFTAGQDFLIIGGAPTRVTEPHGTAEIVKLGADPSCTGPVLVALPNVGVLTVTDNVLGFFGNGTFVTCGSLFDGTTCHELTLQPQLTWRESGGIRMGGRTNAASLMLPEGRLYVLGGQGESVMDVTFLCP